ncbi:heavy metal-responsive transcriptional regulator [Leifsonia sp. L25]|uniref:heavy metal-responsive transcriptional regulator n=1 Tax=Actinomycetes TaxID=1760 RepID=UPI003D68C0C1
MLIGELAERAHINPQTVRFYERRGLVAEPPRTPSGYRDYTSAAVARIQFIRSAQTAGLTLKDIRGILQIRDSGSAPCDHVTTVLDTKLTEVRQRLRELADLENELMAILQSRQRLDTRHCSPDAICTLLAPTTPTLPTQAST